VMVTSSLLMGKSFPAGSRGYSTPTIYAVSNSN
jgi:hypothetical protein